MHNLADSMPYMLWESIVSYASVRHVLNEKYNYEEVLAIKDLQIDCYIKSGIHRNLQINGLSLSHSLTHSLTLSQEVYS